MNSTSYCSQILSQAENSFNLRHVPRIVPRREQLIRAQRAAEFNLVTMLDPHEASDPWRMAAAINALPARPKPLSVAYKIDLKGLERIGRVIDEIKQRAGVRSMESVG